MFKPLIFDDMLDLKKLEERLDKALTIETSESLTNWLQEKRLRTLLQSLGEGTFENMPQNHTNKAIIKSNSTSFAIEYSDISCSQVFPIAA